VDPAKPHREIGREGNCLLPVTVLIPESWTEDSVPGMVAGDTGEGRYIHLQCRVLFGNQFAGLYVWEKSIGEDIRDMRKVLEMFLATRDSAHDALYRDTQVGSQSGVEVTWLGALGKRGRALAYLPVDAGFGTLVISIGGASDDDTFEDDLVPAYLLAKQSIAPK
jgi:hypothetical protein